ncbi:T9SS type A sorting domain-containing protein [Flavivirga sp. 57AJ16]|uniref:T9SS type A sorting domain-containing protein n=1 Tax=Flavivirga sp. 57AJ16 TaxID=3025307 RepID=UPI002366910C|nr:T9SS type A sorting domain-containing protein [Flavivirga sp. 57AJ16]MDD7888157.1 T9SS type A sorting domain-containing protein [Flavivirga sp. 57AJ16]
MNTITNSKCLFNFLMITVQCTFGFGQSIYNNPITGTNPNTSNPYTIGETFDSNITVSGIGRGSGISGANANNRYNANNWNLAGLNTNDYFEFTLTPNACYEIDFISFVYSAESTIILGPASFAFRSSMDGYSSNIGTPNATGTTIDLSAYQNISVPITFRFYAWGGLNLLNGHFSINDFTFNGLVSAITTTWSSGTWSNGLPSLGKHVIIDDDYDTSVGGIQTSFSACSITLNPGYNLNIANATYIEVDNDLVVDTDSHLTVQPYGSFIQNNDAGAITVNGDINVIKRTSFINAWYEYTYWSSPVSGETIGTALAESQPGRRYSFNASQFNDAYAETNNNNVFVLGQDDFDDEGNDWQSVDSSTPMVPGVGYAAMHSKTGFPPLFPPPYQFDYTFEGPFNNGVINVPVYRNDVTTLDFNWNLIGNPYPSAIDIDAFMTQNMYPAGPLEGAIYFWSQYMPPSSTANGNEDLNFSAADYAVYNVGVGGIQGGDPTTPNGFIPSGQAFLVSFSDTYPTSTGTVVFNNSMRSLSLSPDNSQFFKTANSKSKNNSTSNKLWIDLTSDNGIFNQILIGYVEGATNNDDGSFYDANKIVAPKTPASLYSTIKNSVKKFVIQGKAVNSLDADETIALGFTTNIDVATLYTLSIAQLQGDFLTNNTIYLKDNVLDKVHNLSESEYTFTSNPGEFNNRFTVMFNNNALTTKETALEANALKIVDLDNELVRFTTSKNLKIRTVSVFDLLGRLLYKFKGQNSTETYNLSKLKNTIYIAKVTLSNDMVITRKSVKK